MNTSARRIPRLVALVALVALATLGAGATAGSNLPESYPGPECGAVSEVPERPEKFETEEAIAEYNGKVDAYNASIEQLLECVREYVTNAASDIEEIQRRSREAIDELNRHSQ